MHSKAFHCFDCDSRDAFLYFVHDDIWAQAWPDYQEEKAKAVERNGKYLIVNGVKRSHPMNCLCLCIPCLEKRLGRPLTLNDFDDSSANDPVRFGFSLRTGVPMEPRPKPDLSAFTLKIKNGDTLIHLGTGTIFEVVDCKGALSPVAVSKGVLLPEIHNGCLSNKEFKPKPEVTP